MKMKRVKKFKHRQKDLARAICKSLGIQNYSIEYIEYIPSAYLDAVTDNVIVKNSSQRIISTSTVCVTTDQHPNRKQRICVKISFFGTRRPNKKILNSKLKTYFTFKPLRNGFEICYYVNPHSL